MNDARSLNKPFTVMTIIGTRPEIIKLSAVIAELDTHFHHVLIHTGQNYDTQLKDVFFKELDVRNPDYVLDVAGTNTMSTVGRILEKVDEVLESVKPSAVLVLGDTNSALSVYAAKRRKIPIFHMEAGNRSFDERVPEEVNRRIIDHTSDINIVYSDITRLNLLREGFPSDRIIKTGSPMFEVLEQGKQKIATSKVLTELGLSPQGYFLASFHREENVNNSRNLARIATALENISSTYNLPIILSTHPRTRKALDDAHIVLPETVRMLAPFGLYDYLQLQVSARCVLSDSGTISEESAILGFPAVNVREAHERGEAMDEAVVTMSGLEPDAVLQAVETALSYNYPSSGERRDFRIPVDYAVPNVSKKVVRIIESYVDYVNRRVWMKDSGK